MDRIIEKKKWTSNKILTIIGISLLLLLLAYIILLRDRRSSIKINPEQIAIATVKAEKFQEFIPVDGVVLPKTTIYIDATLGGTVEEVYVEDGAQLMEGDPIMKLANASMELSYMDQETRMYDAINNLQNSKIALEQNKFLRQKEIVNLQYQIDEATKDFQRHQILYRDGVTTTKEYEDAKRDYDFTVKQLEISLKLQRLDSIAAEDQRKQINESIQRMHANLQLLQKNMKKLLVTSPGNGQLSSFIVEIGQTIPAGERIGQIDIMDGYKMRASIDERYITRINPGQEAEFDFSGSTYSLFVSKIYSEVSGGTFQVDLLFEGDPPTNIVRGQTLQIRLILSSPADAIIVQRGGFFQETGGNWIYVLDNSGDYAVKREIKLGRQNTKFYEVLQGLEPGERVIVSSYSNFGDREKIILK